MPTALVTGATGLVGSYVVERMLADGWSVRALVRDSGRSGWLGRQGAELRAGDVMDVASLARAAAGCSVIVHAAAQVLDGEHWDAYEQLNVRGTSHVITAAERARARLVHVSSVAVYGPGTRYRADGSRTDEETPLLPLPDEAWYARSKRDSEALVMAAHEEGRVWATAVRPSVIYGRRDRQFVPRIGRFIERGFAPIVDGGTSTLPIVHATSVADGIVRAAASDAAGGRAYNLADDFPVTVADFFRLAAQGIGTRLRLIRLPMAVARAGAAAVGTLAPLFGIDRSVVSARSSLDFITRDNPFTSDRARTELAWTPTVHPEDGVPDAFRWWRQHR